MRRLLCLGAVLVLISFGCSDSTGPENSTPTYPEIAGLVAFYEFDGTLENEVSDLHDGTMTTDPTYEADRGGAAGTALYLETQEKVVVPDDPELQITGGITLAAWVRPEASDRAYAAVIDKNYTEAYSFGMWGGITDPDTTRMQAYLKYVSGTTRELVPMGTGAWSHIAFTFDEASGMHRFYLNGAVVDSSTRADELVVNDEDVRIGGTSMNDDYKGGIDQVAIFNRALSPAEVVQLFEFE